MSFASTRLRSSAADSSRSFDADRKSTRLNSSHLGISYAVFCLRKNRWGFGATTDDWLGVWRVGASPRSRSSGNGGLLGLFFNGRAAAKLSPLSLHGALPN